MLIQAPCLSPLCLHLSPVLETDSSHDSLLSQGKLCKSGLLVLPLIKFYFTILQTLGWILIASHHQFSLIHNAGKNTSKIHHFSK